MIRVSDHTYRQVKPVAFTGDQDIVAPLEVFGAGRARALPGAAEATSKLAKLTETIFQELQANSKEIERLEIEKKSTAEIDACR